MLVRAPAAWAVPPGRRSRLVSHLDVAPTLLDMAGAAPVGSLEGRSLVPDLRAGDDAPDGRRLFFERRSTTSTTPSVPSGTSGGSSSATSPTVLDCHWRRTSRRARPESGWGTRTSRRAHPSSCSTSTAIRSSDTMSPVTRSTARSWPGWMASWRRGCGHRGTRLLAGDIARVPVSSRLLDAAPDLPR